MQKINMTCGRFQPMTKGHVNMINEGEAPCIIYRINSSGKMPETLKGFKVGGRIIRPESIKKVINYIDTQEVELTEQEKELLKRPFTNELIDEELEIIRKSNKNIIDVIPVVNFFDALMKFNKFITDNADHYEPQYLMCGDDRADAYAENIEKYEELEDDWQSGKKIPNVLKGKLKINTGKGRTEGVSGTEVRKSILTNDKSKFESIMPKGVGSMFDKFVSAFNEFKDKLQELIKENKEFKNYINNNMKSIKSYLMFEMKRNAADIDGAFIKALEFFKEKYGAKFKSFVDELNNAIKDNDNDFMLLDEADPNWESLISKVLEIINTQKHYTKEKNREWFYDWYLDSDIYDSFENACKKINV